jgi:hypothetical protein
MGEGLSWAFNIRGGIFRAPREQLGTYHSFYPGFNAGSGNVSSDIDRELPVYSGPLNHFPWSYRQHWDSFVFYFTQVDNGGMLPWPGELSLGYSMLPELAGSLLNEHLFYRVGRFDREWAAPEEGNSLVLNRGALPFLGAEIGAVPLSWLRFSAITGALEYSLDNGGSVKVFETQNAFSLGLAEANYRNYVHFSLGSSVVWPKRYELGYLFPLADNFLAQNNIGDFDNMAAFFSLAGQYPGLGKLWFSFFLDEINPEAELFSKDRSMYAFQGGLAVPFPWLPFGKIALSYTKIEPYCYTHTRVYTPWYGQDGEGNRLLMEEAYTNGGSGLGYYLPPNSDELKLRLAALAGENSRAHFQYQMVRHGAAYGSAAVDGSDYRSELSSNGRADRPELRKFFLRDGAYEWLHIIRFGGDYTFRAGASFPLTLYGEAGLVVSYFTNIEEGKANSGAAYPWRIVDTPEYPQRLRFIASLGIRLFPGF